MSVFYRLIEHNPELAIEHMESPAFEAYGRILTGYDWSDMMSRLQTTPMPEEGNCYVANDTALRSLAVVEDLKLHCFGGQEVQAGYCNGHSVKLNALEYHKSAEVLFTIDDIVLLLASAKEIRGNTLPSSLVTAFFLPRGTAVELFPLTLHFAPCQVSDAGFRCLIVLPIGTNTPLETPTSIINEEDALLYMRNKWLIAHPESIPASRGAWAGITGSNITLRYE